MPPSKIVKIFAFAVLWIISAILFWQSLAKIYLEKDLKADSFAWLGGWLLVFLVFFLIFSFLVEKKEIFLLICSIVLLIFFLFFPFHDYSLIGLIILFLVFVISRALMQKERNERLKISLLPVFKRGLKLTLFFLAIFFAFLSYLYPLIKINEREISLPPKILEWILKPLNSSLSKTLSFFDKKTTINEIIAINTIIEKPNFLSSSPEILKKIQGKDLKEIFKNQEIAEILKKESKKINPQIIEREKNELAKSLGIEINGNEEIGEVINKLVNKQLQNALGPYLKYLPLILAVFVFVSLEIIFIPFSWLVILVTLFIFQILLIFRLVKVEKVMKEGEDIRI